MKNPDPDDTGALSIQTVRADGTAPRRRMATSTAAYSAYVKFRQANMRRDARFGDIAGMMAGFPPVAPVTEERNGHAMMPNVNLKQFIGKLSTYVGTWTAINSTGDGFAEIQAIHEDPMEAERRGKVLTEEFNAAIRIWDADDEDCFESGSEYALECSARDTQMGAFGIGCAFMRDHIDFRFRMIPTRRVLVAEGTRLTLDNCSAMFIEDSMSVTDLYEKRDKPGWNKNAILRNLYDHVEYLGPQSARRYTFSEWVNQIRNNDTWLLNEYLPVRLIHSFVREFDGSISQMTFTDLFGTGRASGALSTANKKDPAYMEAGDSFVYDKPKRAYRWRQIIVPFADNAGPECDWHGVKGFGDLIFDGCHLNNQMFSKAASGAIMTNLLMFQGSSESDTQKLDQLTFSQFGMLAPGLQMEQIRFQADIEGAMSIVNAGSQFIAENTRIAPPSEKTVTNEQPTATQVQADRTDRAQLTTLQIAIYRAVGQDVLFGEMYRRISRASSEYPDSWGGGMVAKRFRNNCAKRNIPEADLAKVKLVRANRNVGSGDLALDIMKADQLLSVATPGRGQLNARKEKVAALKGPEMVAAFIEEAPQPTPQDQQIGNENNLIQLGQIPTAFGWEDQLAHVQSHMQLLAQASQAASQIMDQGITPDTLDGANKLANLMAAGIQHVGQHTQLMSELRGANKQPPMFEKVVADVTKQLHNLTQVHDALMEDAGKVQQSQQPQQTPEMAKAQQEMQIRDAEAKQKLQQSAEAHRQKMGNLAITTQARTHMKLQDHEVTLATKEAQTHEELAANRLKTGVEVADAALKNHHQLAHNAAVTIQELMHKHAAHQQEMELAAAEPDAATE